MKRRNSTTDSVCTKGGSVIPFNYSFTLRHAKNAKCSSYDSMYVLNVTAKGWFYSSLENLAYNLETDQPPLRLWKAERPGCNLFNISKLKVQRERRYLHKFKVSPLRYLLNTNRKIVTSWWRNLAETLVWKTFQHLWYDVLRRSHMTFRYAY